MQEEISTINKCFAGVSLVATGCILLVICIRICFFLFHVICIVCSIVIFCCYTCINMYVSINVILKLNHFSNSIQKIKYVN